MTDHPHGRVTYVRSLDGVETSDSQVRLLASTRRRVVAKLVDIGTVLLPVGAVALVMWLAAPYENWFIDEYVVWLAVPTLGAMVLLLALLVARFVMMTWAGVTVGRRIAGVVVVQAADGVSPPTLRQVFRRSVIPRSSPNVPVFPLVHDFLVHRGDHKLGQCLHDRNAETVVLQDDRPRHMQRVALGVGYVLVVAALTVPAVPALAEVAAGPPLTVRMLWGEGDTFASFYGGRGAVLRRTSAQVFDDPQGCRAGAVDARVRDVLSRLDCRRRAVATFVAADGAIHATSLVLSFPREDAARTAAGQLRVEDFRWPSAQGPMTGPKQPGYTRGGEVDYEEFYVVVTVLRARIQGPGAIPLDQAEQTFDALHAGVQGRIILR